MWPEVRGLLIPLQGCVGQIVILDLPQSEMERVLQTFVSRVENPQIFVMANFAPKEPIVPSAGILEVIANDVQNIAQIEGFLPTADFIKLMIEPDEEWRRLVELVFWPREFFPNPDDDADCTRRFGLLVDLAEALRGNDKQLRCVLLGEPVEITRAELESPFCLVW